MLPLPSTLSSQLLTSFENSVENRVTMSQIGILVSNTSYRLCVCARRTRASLHIHTPEYTRGSHTFTHVRGVERIRKLVETRQDSTLLTILTNISPYIAIYLTKLTLFLRFFYTFLFYLFEIISNPYFRFHSDTRAILRSESPLVP